MKQILRSRYNIAFNGTTRFLWLLLFIAISTFGCFAKKNIEIEHNSRYYASKAQNYEDAGAWDAAKRLIDEGLQHYPNDPDLRYLNGRYYFRAEGDLHQARYNLIKAIQENDQHYFAKRTLVDVEEESKHYSSAICYINELLEFQPYDRDLWRRKISLYRKIGQKAEADDALERLAQIYPNDSIVSRELNSTKLQNWTNRDHIKTTPEGAAKELETLLADDPYELQYYLDLIKQYTIMGQTERAIGVANRGLIYIPGNGRLIEKAAALMGEVGDYTRAMAFLKQHRYTGKMYNNFVRMAAEEARWHDAYEANGRLYARTKDLDALTYLVNTSIVRGYYPDAIDYLNEAYKIYGRTPELLIKQYGLEKRFGNKEVCIKLLEELYTLTPSNEEIVDDYTELMLALANNSIQNEDWTDALAELDKALSLMTPDNEKWPGTISKKIMVLGHLNRYDEAQRTFLTAAEKKPLLTDRFADAYQTIALSRLKRLIDNEEYSAALKDAEGLIEILGQTEGLLRICINMSQTLGKKDKFYFYASEGYRKFPDTPYFIIKQATALDQQGRTEEALRILNPERYKDDEYFNPQLVNAYAGLSGEYANILLKHHKPKDAMMWIDRGLAYDVDNKELLYMKGLAYEQLKEYDKAYFYLSRYYNPSNAEQEEWEEQMHYMRWRSFKNHVDFSYLGAFFNSSNDELSSIGHMYSIATVAYSHLFRKHTLMAQVSYKGIDGTYESTGFLEGGAGVELLGEWDWTINHRWSMLLSGSYATRFFNKIGANLGFFLDCGRGWTAGLKAGYRLTAPTYIYKNGELPQAHDYKRYNLLMLTPSVEKAWNRIRTSASADLVYIHKGIYYNVGLKWKLFINEDNVSSVSVLAGFGTFPELNFFDQTALSNISHSNASVGAEFMYLFTKHLAFSFNFNWNTDYNPKVLNDGSYLSSYRNIFSVFVGLHTAF